MRNTQPGARITASLVSHAETQRAAIHPSTCANPPAKIGGDAYQISVGVLGDPESRNYVAKAGIGLQSVRKRFRYPSLVLKVHLLPLVTKSGERPSMRFVICISQEVPKLGIFLPGDNKKQRMGLPWSVRAEQRNRLASRIDTLGAD